MIHRNAKNAPTYFWLNERYEPPLGVAITVNVALGGLD
jgi:hypothetical protein